MSLQQSEFHIERLESRLLLAGNVDADVRGGTLFVDGDDLSNRIIISGNGTTVNIAGADGTTINGLETDAFAGVTRNVVIRMRDGFDSVTMDELSVDGILSLNAGAGAARVHLSNSMVSGDVRIATGAVAPDDSAAFGSYGISQTFRDNVIDGRISIRNGAVELDGLNGIVTRIESNEVRRGVQVRHGNVDVAVVDNTPFTFASATSTKISGNSITGGGVRVTAGRVRVNQSARYTAGNEVSVSDNITITGGLFVRLGSTETSNVATSATRVEGNSVIVQDNLLIDGRLNIRVDNATVTAERARTVRGNLTSVADNREITGSVIVRQGSATAVGTADTAIGNKFTLESNTVSGQVTAFNGDASVVSGEDFAYALGVNNVIESNELDRIRVSSRSGSSSSTGFAAGILNEFRDNTVSRDVFISDGNAMGSVADALLSMSNSSIDGRLNYVGRNGRNALSLDSMEVAGRVLARTGNGDDAFMLTDSTFENSVRFDGAGGDADEFFEFGGNIYEMGRPVLVGIENGA